MQIAAEQKNIELAAKKAERKEKELLETQVKPAEADKRCRNYGQKQKKLNLSRKQKL